MSKFNYFSYKEKRLSKLSPNEAEDLVFDLIHAFSFTRTPIDSALLLQDLLTEKEVMNLAKRLRIAKLIILGNTTEEIVTKLHCSAATVSKVRMWLDRAGAGLTKVIKNLPKRRKVYTPRRIPGIGAGLDQFLLYYATKTMTDKEKRGLEEFLSSMRAKSAEDKDFREETSYEFREKSRKKKVTLLHKGVT